MNDENTNESNDANKEESNDENADKSIGNLAFKHYRQEIRFEHGLLSARLNSMLISQALLFAGWCLIYSNRLKPRFSSSDDGTENLIHAAWQIDPSAAWALIAISIVAIIILILSLIAVSQTCISIRTWHNAGNAIDAEITLMGLHRNLPDRIHELSVDYLATVLPVSLLGFWFWLILHAIGLWALATLPIVIFLCWRSALWVIQYIRNESQPE